MRKNLKYWASLFEKRVLKEKSVDAAHDTSHIKRVVANAKHIARLEKARLEIVYPAAWLHDLGAVKKGNRKRSSSSRKSARMAEKFLLKSHYPKELIPDIKHAIEAHSFSAGIVPRTLEAKVVQDADRLDALGSIGLARCFLTSASIRGQVLYRDKDPLAERTNPDEGKYALDHIKVKPLRIVHTMQTRTGRAEARRRQRIMLQFLSEFKTELAFPSAAR